MKVNIFIKMLEGLDPDANIVAPTLDCINTIGANDYGDPYIVDADAKLNDDTGTYALASKISTSLIIF